MKLKKIGPHTVTCASVGDALALAPLPARVNILYTDPPWGPGLVKMFATMRHKATGAPKEPPIGFDAMMDRLYTIATTRVSDHVFIEMGEAYADDVLQALIRRFGLANRYATVYGSGKSQRPAVLLHAAAKGVRLPDLPLDGLGGPKLVRAALAAVTTGPQFTVFDPFCGHGLTAEATAKLGGVFYGNEFNSHRLAKTIAKLERLTS